MVVPFPFSDLSEASRRPALVVAELGGEDVILCQITSQSVRDEDAVRIDDNDFESGGLRQVSNVRPNRVFTADEHIILYRAGHLKTERVQLVISKMVQLLSR